MATLRRAEQNGRAARGIKGADWTDFVGGRQRRGAWRVTFERRYG